MREGTKGVAKTTEATIRSIGLRQAQAWRQHSVAPEDGKPRQSAEILRLDDFRPVPPVPARRYDTAEMELLHAKITGMTRGLENQSEACRAFKAQIAALRAEIEEMGTNMDLYRARLAGIDANPIRRKALRLAQMMDPWTRK